MHSEIRLGPEISAAQSEIRIWGPQNLNILRYEVIDKIEWDLFFAGKNRMGLKDTPSPKSRHCVGRWMLCGLLPACPSGTVDWVSLARVHERSSVRCRQPGGGCHTRDQAKLRLREVAEGKLIFLWRNRLYREKDL